MMQASPTSTVELPCGDGRRHRRDQSGKCTAAVLEPLLARARATANCRADRRAGTTDGAVHRRSRRIRSSRDARQRTRLEPSRDPRRTALIAAQVACSTHRFAEARESLAQAVSATALRQSDADRLSLDDRPGHGREASRGAGGAARASVAAWPLGRTDSARRAARATWARSTRPIAHIEGAAEYSGRLAVCACVGVAFSWACCGAKRYRCRKRSGRRAGIAARSTICLAT